MRMSCNGCRVLRKGCSDNCSIRPCLQWIKNPESQANATVFLAKFYGRAGLMNLINAGPEHLRPAIFRSLLYEACGRIVNPIYGSVGLLWSGSWQMCQAAVEAVLKGAPIAQIPSEAAANTSTPPLRAYDIRHVSKDAAAAAAAITTTTDLHKVAKASRIRFKRSGTTSSNNAEDRSMPVTTAAGAEQADTDTEAQVCDLRWSVEYHHREQSHDSSASHESDHQRDRQQLTAGENESMLSADTPDASQVTSHADVECNRNESRGDASEVELELTLGHYSSSNASSPRSHDDAPVGRRERCDSKPLDGLGSEACRVELALDLTV